MTTFLAVISDAGLNTLIVALSGFFTAITAYFMARTKTATEAIHVAVNSEHTALLKEIKELRDQILLLSTDKARLIEKDRGTVTAAAVAAATNDGKT